MANHLGVCRPEFLAVEVSRRQPSTRGFYPAGRPDSLTDKDSWAKTAYILRMNHIDPGSQLGAEIALQIRLHQESCPPHHGRFRTRTKRKRLYLHHQDRAFVMGESFTKYGYSQESRQFACQLRILPSISASIFSMQAYD